jgi:CheY-like chemotaxis protein
MSDAHGRPNRIVVLVVEDEPLVRALAVDVLEEAGFEVIEASNADYALIVLERRSDIRVIFTDVEMPGRLNGFELARIVQDHHHRVRIIVGSGRVCPRAGDIAPHTVFLPKPYAADALVRAVRGMLP